MCEGSLSVDGRRLVARLPDPCIPCTWCWLLWKRLPWYLDTQQVYGALPLASGGEKAGRRGGETEADPEKETESYSKNQPDVLLCSCCILYNVYL